MEQFWQIFWTALGTVITLLVTWATGKLISIFDKAEKGRELARHAAQLTQIVSNAVLQVNQTLVSGMKKAGSFDKKAQDEALQRCLTIIQSQLSTELKDYIVANFGDISTHLLSLIEATIYKSKEE